MLSNGSIAMSTHNQSWDELRRKTRNLESVIDARLTSYSQLASKITGSAEPSTSANPYADHTTLDMDGSGKQSTAQINEHTELEVELEDLLNQLTDSVDGLTAKLDDPAVPPSASQLHAVQRHREVLMDFTRDLRRSKTNVRHAIDRRDLLGNVRGDIKYVLTHLNPPPMLALIPSSNQQCI